MNYDQSSLPPLLLQVLAEQQTWKESGERSPLHSNVSLEEALQLYNAVRAIQPVTSAEVGFAQGVSATAILAALAGNGKGHHHVLDPYQKHYDNSGLYLTRQAGFAQWMEFHEAFAEDVIPRLPELQFAFIDASHLFDLTLVEFVLVDKKLAVGGVVGFHDLWMPSLRKVIRYLLANRHYEIYRPPGEPGPAPSGKKRLRAAAASCLGKLPGSHRIFSEELLSPFSSLGFRNLALLRKTAHDDRDWRFHAPF